MIVRWLRKLVGNVECVGFPIKFPDNIVAIDTETTGLDPWGTYGVDRPTFPARPFMFTLCNADGDTAHIRWQVDPITREVIRDAKTYSLLQEILGNEKLEKVFFNANYDRHMCELSGFSIRGYLHDTLVGMKIINPAEMNCGLKPLSIKYLDMPADDEDSLLASVRKVRANIRSIRKRIEKGSPYFPGESVLAKYSLSDKIKTDDDRGKGDLHLGDPELCSFYGKNDALRTMKLHLAEVEQFNTDQENGGELWSVYRREMELMHAIYRMESYGTGIDRKRLTEVISFYKDYSAKIEKEISKAGGDGLNPNSPKQMQNEFFNKRRYTPLKYSESKKKGQAGKTPSKCMHCKGADGGCKICQFTGNSPKCDSDFLESIGIDKTGEEPAPKDHLAWWLLHYSASNTMLGYVNQYDKYRETTPSGSIIHPNINQSEAITGRMSSSTPNLQNVASDESGKKKTAVPYRPRECFVPRPGKLLYLADYSQIEIWILALLSKDYKFIDSLCKGGDAHQNVAILIWGDHWNVTLALASIEREKNGEKLTEAEKKNLKLHKYYRKIAKNLQFCMVYGGGPAKVASMSGLTLEEAIKFLAEYKERLPFVQRFMAECVGKAKRQGYIVNPYGRVYPIVRDFAYRATNYMIQGTAAEIIKNATIRVDQLCQVEYKDMLNLELIIHDEFILENDITNHHQRVMKAIVTAMQGDSKFMGCPIPFPVGFEIARERWSETQKVKVA